MTDIFSHFETQPRPTIDGWNVPNTSAIRPTYSRCDIHLGLQTPSRYLEWLKGQLVASDKRNTGISSCEDRAPAHIEYKLSVTVGR
jgi:hypothetical protein